VHAAAAVAVPAARLECFVHSHVAQGRILFFWQEVAESLVLVRQSRHWRQVPLADALCLLLTAANVGNRLGSFNFLSVVLFLSEMINSKAKLQGRIKKISTH